MPKKKLTFALRSIRRCILRGGTEALQRKCGFASSDHLVQRMITEQTIVKAAESLSTADLEGEKVILHIEDGQYYGLNQVGAVILDMMQRPVEVNVILDRLVDLFEVERGRLKDDVLRFLNMLKERDLIVVHE